MQRESRGPLFMLDQCQNQVQVHYYHYHSHHLPLSLIIYFCHISLDPQHQRKLYCPLHSNTIFQLASAQLYQNIQFIDFISCAWLFCLFTLHGSLHVHICVIHMHIMYTFFLSTLQNYFIYIIYQIWPPQKNKPVLQRAYVLLKRILKIPYMSRIKYQ